MKITIVGLGYVGCPLAYELAKHVDVYGLKVQLVDPLADPDEVKHEYDVELCFKPVRAHAVVLAVAHKEFVDGGWGLVQQYAVDNGKYVVTDLKAVLDRETQQSNVVLVRP